MSVIDSIVNAVTGRTPAPPDPFVTLTCAIRDAAGVKFGSANQRADLAEKQAGYDRAQREVDRHNDHEAKAAWLRHQADLEAAIARGDLDDLDGYDRNEFEAEFREKMAAAKRIRAAITASCAPVVEALSEDFAAVAEKFASEQTRAEVDAYAKFGIAYPGPSELVKALRSAADQARRQVPRIPGLAVPPRRMVPYVDF
jgi:hypothetical protein